MLSGYLAKVTRILGAKSKLISALGAEFQNEKALLLSAGLPFPTRLPGPRITDNLLLEAVAVDRPIPQGTQGMV